MGECPPGLWGADCDKNCNCEAPWSCTRDEEDLGRNCVCSPNENLGHSCYENGNLLIQRVEK